MMKSKLESWDDSKRRGTIKSDILRDVGRKELAPQRRTTLSPPEEKKRMHLTWQDFDRMLHLLAFGELEELGKVVDDPEEMRRIIEDLVVELEDEIGLFVGLKGGKVAVDTKKIEAALHRKRLHSKNTKDHAAISLLEQGEGGGLVQVRGTMAKGRTGTERCSGVRKR